MVYRSIAEMSWEEVQDFARRSADLVRGFYEFVGDAATARNEADKERAAIMQSWKDAQARQVTA